MDIGRLGAGHAVGGCLRSGKYDGDLFIDGAWYVNPVCGINAGQKRWSSLNKAEPLTCANHCYRPRNNHSPRYRHRNKPQRHQSNRNVHMPITHTFTHHLRTIREQCCTSRSIPVAWESHLWFGGTIIVYITKHKKGRLMVGGRCTTPHAWGGSESLLLWPAFAR
jgi:hypothetical protein